MVSVIRVLICKNKFLAKKRARSSAADTQIVSSSGSEKGEEIVIKKQVDWLESEDKKIKQKYLTEEAEAKFKRVIHDSTHEDNLSKDDLKHVFREMGIFFVEDMFEKIWKLFDANGDGKVNKKEFSVAFCFLCLKGTAKDNVSLAFALFDTDRNNEICKREFNDMMASIIGNSLRSVCAFKKGRDAFEKHIQREYSEELLDFVDKVGFLEPSGGGVSMNVTKAKAVEIFEKYLQVGAAKQINISDSLRTRIQDEIKSIGDDEELISLNCFSDAAKEAVILIEEGPLSRFKDVIRQTESYFASDAWDELGIAQDKGMTRKQFRLWARKSPQLFQFFDDMKEVLTM